MADNNLMGENQNDPLAVDPVEPNPAPADPAPADPAPADPAPADPAPDVTLTLTEDLKSQGVNQDIIDAFTPLVKGMDAETVAKFTELGAKIYAQSEANAQEYWENLNSEWMKDLESDREIGGDKLDASSVQVNNLIQKFDQDNQLAEFLKTTNQQNCAPLFKFLHRVSSQFTEDQLVVDGDGNKAKNDTPAHMRMGYRPLDEY